MLGPCSQAWGQLRDVLFYSRCNTVDIHKINLLSEEINPVFPWQHLPCRPISVLGFYGKPSFLVQLLPWTLRAQEWGGGSSLNCGMRVWNLSC